MQAIMAGELSSEEALNDPYVQELYEAAGGNEEETPTTVIPDIFGPQYPEAWGGETKIYEADDPSYSVQRRIEYPDEGVELIVDNEARYQAQDENAPFGRILQHMYSRDLPAENPEHQAAMDEYRNRDLLWLLLGSNPEWIQEFMGPNPIKTDLESESYFATGSHKRSEEEMSRQRREMSRRIEAEMKRNNEPTRTSGQRFRFKADGGKVYKKGYYGRRYK